MKTAVALVSSLLLLATGAAAHAQGDVSADMQTLRNSIAEGKRFLIEANLILTDEQAADFWPLYDEYQAELQILNDRIATLVLDYAEAYNGELNDEQAEELLDESIDIEEAEVALKKKFAKKLNRVMPSTEAARYLQIESKIRALIRFDLAAEIPLAY